MRSPFMPVNIFLLTYSSKSSYKYINRKIEQIFFLRLMLYTQFLTWRLLVLTNSHLLEEIGMSTRTESNTTLMLTEYRIKKAILFCGTEAFSLLKGLVTTPSIKDKSYGEHSFTLKAHCNLASLIMIEQFIFCVPSSRHSVTDFVGYVCIYLPCFMVTI